MPRMTSAQKRKLDRLITNGMPIQGIVKSVGVSATTVSKRKKLLQANGSDEHASEQDANGRFKEFKKIKWNREAQPAPIEDRVAKSILSELQELRVENARLRKAMEIIQLAAALPTDG